MRMKQDERWCQQQSQPGQSTRDQFRPQFHCPELWYFEPSTAWIKSNINWLNILPVPAGSVSDHNFPSEGARTEDDSLTLSNLSTFSNDVWIKCLWATDSYRRSDRGVSSREDVLDIPQILLWINKDESPLLDKWISTSWQRTRWIKHFDFGSHQSDQGERWW